VQKFTVNDYRAKPIEPDKPDADIGHGYAHNTELWFYRLLQSKGIPHVEDPVELMKSSSACYTENTGNILIPHVTESGELEFESWFPDAIIRLPDGNIHFVELKSNDLGRRWKYSNFRKFYSRGKQEFKVEESVLKSRDRRGLERFNESYRDFFRVFGDRKNIRFHMLALKPRGVNTWTLRGNPDGKRRLNPVPITRSVPGKLQRLFTRYNLPPLPLTSYGPSKKPDGKISSKRK